MTVSNIDKNNIYKMWNWLYEYDYMSAAVILVVTDKNKMSIHMSMYNAYEHNSNHYPLHTHNILHLCDGFVVFFFFQDSGPFETRWIFVHSIYWNTIKRNKK